MPPGQPDLGQQQRLARIGEQPDVRLQPGRCRRDAQVEQGGAARDMRGAAVRIR